MRRLAYFSAIVVLFASLAFAQTAPTLPPDVRAQIDKAAADVLASTGVPSASIAVVKDGKIAYVQAYGDAHVDPNLAAKPGMRYGIGSISKQFTAAAMLLLQEQGKLSIDDPVAKYVPDLTRANEITLRMLLSHTSGYQDYWPQDYVMPMMLKPTTAQNIMNLYAKKPLDFEPGTKWQYSNTNFVIAGAIIEKLTGMSVYDFLSKNVFTPLQMRDVNDVDQPYQGDKDAFGYRRFALGPPRQAPKEGKGWLFAAGELNMAPEELAKWNISLINQTILKPASYKDMETEVKLKNGAGTNYGLGVFVMNQRGHRMIEHSGESSGFVAENIVLPDDKAAVTVLTNLDASAAASQIAQKIAPFLLPQEKVDEAKLQFYRQIYEGLQQGKINRALFTDNCNFYFDEQGLKDFASSLGPLGAPQSFTAGNTSERGGMIHRGYTLKYPNKTLRISVFEMPDGKVEQFMVSASQ